MCGIVGALSKNKAFIEPQLVSKMSEAIINRGPDSGGLWVDEEAGISMGHRRLAILDLSNSGHQPMISKTYRYVISFNGEIYNHLDLRLEIELEYGKLIWVGTSDTETLLECFDRWELKRR